MYPDQNSNRKKTGLVVLGVIGAIILMVIVLLLTSSANKPKPLPTDDSTSSSSSTSSNGAQTNSSDSNNWATTEYLKRNGATTQQLDALQQAMYKFATAKKLDVKTLMIDTTSVSHTTSANEDGTGTFNFTAKLNDSTYKVAMQVSGILDARVYVSDSSSGKLLFDSGTIESTVR